MATLANKLRFVYWASGADIVLFTTSARVHDKVQLTVGIPIKRVHMKKASVLSLSLSFQIIQGKVVVLRILWSLIVTPELSRRLV